MPRITATTYEGTSSISYFVDSTVTTTNGTTVGLKRDDEHGISPRLYFKYVKRKFGLLKGIVLERRMKKLIKMAEELEKKGQIAASEHVFESAIKEARESEMYAFGYRIFIEGEHLEKFRYKVKGRAVQETSLKNYTKVIPEDVSKKIKKALEAKVFDDIVIIHYDPKKEGSKLTKEERKDPIAFGVIEETERYYFIDDWEDEYCDLTLDDIITKLSLEEEEYTLPKNPQEFLTNGKPNTKGSRKSKQK